MKGTKWIILAGAVTAVLLAAGGITFIYQKLKELPSRDGFQVVITSSTKNPVVKEAVKFMGILRNATWREYELQHAAPGVYSFSVFDSSGREVYSSGEGALPAEMAPGMYLHPETYQVYGVGKLQRTAAGNSGSADAAAIMYRTPSVRGKNIVETWSYAFEEPGSYRVKSAARFTIEQEGRQEDYEYIFLTDMTVQPKEGPGRTGRTGGQSGGRNQDENPARGH